MKLITLYAVLENSLYKFYCRLKSLFNISAYYVELICPYTFILRIKRIIKLFRPFSVEVVISPYDQCGVC